MLGSEIPAGQDPLADGILMAHQKAWLADPSDLKLCEKGRRTGITYAEALGDTLIAASARSAGGDNVYYIGDTKDKGLEFIRYVAHFARVVQRETAAIEEFLFEDKRDDGESKHITAFRVKFASGFQVVALSSRPANIRGLQGIVVIDEAAFHKDVKEVIAAVNALLIWGGKIRIISTHNGEDNPFNLLVQESREGIYDYALHRYTFQDAIDNGLYERVCLVRGWTPSEQGFEAWYNRVVKSYGSDAEARDEELFAVPSKSSGRYLPRQLIKQCQAPGIPVVTFERPENWYLDRHRLDEARDWFEDNLAPIIRALPEKRRTCFGQDFGRDGHLSVIWVLQHTGLASWRTAFVLEMRRIPFDVQQFVLFEICDRLPMFMHGKLDARGNGQSQAEAAQQRYGASMIECVKATVEWYAAAFPEYRAAFEDRAIVVPESEDIIADHRQVVLVKGRPAMADEETTGVDGQKRHGDTAVAGLLAWMSVLTAKDGVIEHRASGRHPAGFDAFEGQRQPRLFETDHQSRPEAGTDYSRYDASWQ